MVLSLAQHQMRIRVVQSPTEQCVDGVRLDLYAPGAEYDLGTTLAILFLAEGWGEPVASDECPLPASPSDFVPTRPRDLPSNLVREIFPLYYDAPAALAADRRRTRRSSNR